MRNTIGLPVARASVSEIEWNGHGPGCVCVQIGSTPWASAVVGVAVQPGTVLFQVADLSSVWVTAEVYEQDVARIHVGQRARFELTSYPGEMHVGKVRADGPPQGRTIPIVAGNARVAPVFMGQGNDAR